MTASFPSLREIRPPLVAILRGLPLADAEAVGLVLIQAGIRIIEVPLNRPEAIDCIRRLVALAPEGVTIGGGTVLTTADVDAVHDAGGRLVVSPNCQADVIDHARRAGLFCAPGVATPTEAFTALRHGAHALKLFPAEVIGVQGLRAFKSVLPEGTALWPVGGVTAERLGDWMTAGATGFGIGSQLYQPGLSIDEIGVRAAGFVAAWQAHTGD